ncbi:hypothetical protein CEG14_09310 [Bordetella genomosp. 1]|uniref:Lipoprotein n=1 Tax=Bordetella genomosp. 1 TaxID=1395607 RepID=A0A261SE08_9BORD|nr:hypothetical protein [Bordetella genomosp. 1]OZI35291.1 hypothetical protein CEG14_09310 [Bordetella genomosp. 1]
MNRTCKAQSFWRHGTRVAAFAVVATLAGCAFSPAACNGFGPGKVASLAVPANTPTEKVFACLEQETIARSDGGYLVDKGVPVRDAANGIFETEQFNAQNVSGFRLRAQLRQPSTLALSLRGAGAYCADLGVDKEMTRLQQALTACLQR